MNFAEILQRIGEAAYHDACANALKTASGVFTGIPRFDSTLAHEISTLIWEGASDPCTKLELVFRFYESMPCYAYLLFVKLNENQLISEARERMWALYRKYLAGDTLLADCAQYSLWCDFFEDPETVTEAWNALKQGFASELLLRRVLFCAGPVPFAWKESVYLQLLSDRAWHEVIFKSLLASRFDAYGNIDPDRAGEILKKLELPLDTSGFAQLRDALESGRS